MWGDVLCLYLLWPCMALGTTDLSTWFISNIPASLSLIKYHTSSIISYLGGGGGGAAHGWWNQTEMLYCNNVFGRIESVLKVHSHLVSTSAFAFSKTIEAMRNKKRKKWALWGPLLCTNVNIVILFWRIQEGCTGLVTHPPPHSPGVGLTNSGRFHNSRSLRGNNLSNNNKTAPPSPELAPPVPKSLDQCQLITIDTMLKFDANAESVDFAARYERTIRLQQANILLAFLSV